MTVQVDGKNLGQLDQLDRGPTVFELASGRHELRFMGDGRTVLWTKAVSVGGQEVVVVQFRPPGRRPAWGTRREGHWWLYRISGPIQ